MTRRRAPSRRTRAWRWTAAVLAVLLVPVVGLAGWLYVGSGRGNVGELTFANRLHIPPLLDPQAGPDGRKRFDLTLQAGRSRLLPGAPTPTWGINDAHLGPTLRARRGDHVTINVTNTLPEATSLHWHGMLLPPAMDGGPHQPIRPGGTWTPSFEVQQPAATLWYYPHLHATTAAHVYRGLAGLFLLDDPQTDRLSLPNRYGVNDIPLLIQDRTFRSDNTLDTTNLGFGGTAVTGLLGEELLVNGTHNPHLQVTATRTRLRVLNASNARIYNLGFSDHRRFRLIGTDSSLLPAPQPLRRVQLSPGERAELVAEFTPGERVVLRSFPPTLGANPLYERLAGGDDTFDVLQLRAAPGSTPHRRCLLHSHRPGPSRHPARRGSAPSSWVTSPSTARPWTWAASTRSCPPAAARCGRWSMARRSRTTSTSTMPPSQCSTSTANRRR
jgi:FtsP/CotA-like multicopper oxidase with cupredoxin domain